MHTLDETHNTVDTGILHSTTWWRILSVSDRTAPENQLLSNFGRGFNLSPSVSCASCLAGYDTGVLVHPYRVEGAVPGCRSKNLASGHEDQEIVDTQAMTSSKGGACSQECSTTLQEKNEKLLQMGAFV